MGLFGAFSLVFSTRPIHCDVVFSVFGPFLPPVACRCGVLVAPLPRRAEIDFFYVKNEIFGLFSVKFDKKSTTFTPLHVF